MGIEILYNSLFNRRGYISVLGMALEALQRYDHREVARLSDILLRSEFKRSVIPDLQEKLLEAQRHGDIEKKETCDRLLKIYANQLFETDPEYAARLSRMRAIRRHTEQALALPGR